MIQRIACAAAMALCALLASQKAVDASVINLPRAAFTRMPDIDTMTTASVRPRKIAWTPDSKILAMPCELAASVWARPGPCTMQASALPALPDGYSVRHVCPEPQVPGSALRI